MEEKEALKLNIDSGELGRQEYSNAKKRMQDLEKVQIFPGRGPWKTRLEQIHALRISGSCGVCRHSFFHGIMISLNA